eukprot:3665151-Rhodomonas_salina.3
MLVLSPIVLKQNNMHRKKHVSCLLGWFKLLDKGPVRKPSGEPSGEPERKLEGRDFIAVTIGSFKSRTGRT